MKKIISVLFVVVLTLVANRPAQAAAADPAGIEASASYYQPRDARFNAEGINFGFNFRIQESLTLGYRVEVIHGQGHDTIPGPPKKDVTAQGEAISQGLTAFYRVVDADNAKIGLDAGLWAGEMTTTYQPPAAHFFPATSPFVEPLLRLNYHTGANAKVIFGVGYRLVRGFTAIPAPFGAGSAPLNNFDGLDLSLGVGYNF